MKTSQFERLRSSSVIVLSAGHGDGDSGAENGPHQEAEQTKLIVDAIALRLKKAGIAVDTVPHEYGLTDAIAHANSQYKPDDAWVIEIHRDSADNLPEIDASWRCGAYYYPSQTSAEIASFLVGRMKAHGAHGTSWARPDTMSKHGRLAWVRDTNPVAHLLELGFMQGKNTKAHLGHLAEIAARSLYEAFTGLAWDDNVTEAASDAAASMKVAPKVPMISVTPASALLDQLVSAYKATDLRALFKRIKADIHAEDFDDLQNASLAQWILESGWAKSNLARDHFNFGGLKWRSEMANWTLANDGVEVTKVEYNAWDGKDYYCKFTSPDAFISGYWRFIMRSPYKGWEDHASNPRDYIDYLLKCHYTESDTYLDEVMSLVPRAVALLAGASPHAEELPSGTSPGTVVVPIVATSPAGPPGPGALNAPVAAGSIGSVGGDHWLTSAKKVFIEGGSNLSPLYVVIHYTEGYSASSSIEGWKNAKNGILAHIVVDRDGTIYQCRPFNRSCGHAGGTGLARWQDPRSGKLYDGANSVSIGIEIANTGMKENLHKKLGTGSPYPKGTTVAGVHRNGKHGSSEAKSGKNWEEYPKAQLQAVFDLVALLVKTYDLHDITGHDCISSERKADPGPAFPMLELREANGFTGLPVVWDTNGEQLPV